MISYVAGAVVGLLASVVFAESARAQSCAPDTAIMYYSYGQIELPQSGWDVFSATMQRARASGCRARSISIDGSMDPEWDQRTGVAVAEQRMNEIINRLVRLGAPRQIIQNRVQMGSQVLRAPGVREPLNRNIYFTIEYY